MGGIWHIFSVMMQSHDLRWHYDTAAAEREHVEGSESSCTNVMRANRWGDNANWSKTWRLVTPTLRIFTVRLIQVMRSFSPQISHNHKLICRSVKGCGGGKKHFPWRAYGVHSISCVTDFKAHLSMTGPRCPPHPSDLNSGEIRLSSAPPTQGSHSAERTCCLQ